MNNNLLAFRQFSDIQQANELLEIFTQNGIEARLADNVPSLDTTFTGGSLANKVEIQIPANDFEKAEALLQKYSSQTLETISKDYYLFSFTNEELYDILLKSDEWGELDYELAQKILLDRGELVNDELLNNLKKERYTQLSKPEKRQTGWIVFGYISALLGGWLGLLIGYMLYKSKKTMPDGRRVYSYQQKDRKHGMYIFYISVVIAPLALVYRAFIVLF